LIYILYGAQVLFCEPENWKTGTFSILKIFV